METLEDRVGLTRRVLERNPKIAALPFAKYSACIDEMKLRRKLARKGGDKAEAKRLNAILMLCGYR